MRMYLLLSMMLSGAGMVHAADIYRCPGANGQTVFQQQPCTGEDKSAPMATTAPEPKPATPEQARCPRLADAVRQIGRGYQDGLTEAHLRQQLQSQLDGTLLNDAFRHVAMAGAIPPNEVALLSLLACETLAPLPPLPNWQQGKSKVTIKLNSWQQTISWPTLLQLNGMLEQPSAQLEWLYAERDLGSLRVGCRAHSGGERLLELGNAMLAFWAEQLHPGATEDDKHGSAHGYLHRTDYHSKRRLYQTTINTRKSTRLGDIVPTIGASVALTPERVCLIANRQRRHDRDMLIEAGQLIEALLVKTDSPSKK